MNETSVSESFRQRVKRVKIPDYIFDNFFSSRDMSMGEDEEDDYESFDGCIIDILCCPSTNNVNFVAIYVYNTKSTTLAI